MSETMEELTERANDFADNLCRDREERERRREIREHHEEEASAGLL